MAQPHAYGYMFLGAVYLEGNDEYALTDILTKYPGANLFTLKTKPTKSQPVMVTVKGGATSDAIQSVAFPLEFNESTAWDKTTPIRIIFNRSVTVAIAKQVETA